MLVGSLWKELIIAAKAVAACPGTYPWSRLHSAYVSGALLDCRGEETVGHGAPECRQRISVAAATASCLPPGSSPVGARAPGSAISRSVPGKGVRHSRGGRLRNSMAIEAAASLRWSSDRPGRPIGVDRPRAPGANWEKRSAGVVSRGCTDAPSDTMERS